MRSMGKWDWAGIPANVLLFLPFGFALAASLSRQLQGLRLIVAVTVLGGGASAAVELLQLFLPTRTTSLLDLVTNTAGAVLGALCVYFWPAKWLDRLEQLGRWLSERLTIPSVRMVYGVYLLIGILLPLSIYSWSGRSTWTWNPDYPLVFGNEANGERAWKGKIWRVELADTAVSAKDASRVYTEGLDAIAGETFLGSYTFTEQAALPAGSGRLPSLYQRGPGVIATQEGAITLPGNAWLQSVGPAKRLTERIRRTNQFSLSVMCEPASRLQFGPARIVSLSHDSGERNFTLGQFGDHAAFRMRAPATGPNGTDPELHLFNTFHQLRPVHLLITFDGAHLRAWINGERSAAEVDMRVRPGAALLSRLLFFSPYQIEDYDALFSVLLFVPLGVLAGILGARLRNGVWVPVIFTGVIAPSLLLEAGVWLIGLAFNTGKILLNILLTGVGAFAGTIAAKDLNQIATAREESERKNVSNLAFKERGTVNAGTGPSSGKEQAHFSTTRDWVRNRLPRWIVQALRITRDAGLRAGLEHLRRQWARRRARRKPFSAPEPSNVRAILFVCYGNIIRSPFAAALLEKELAGRNRSLRVISAGLHANPERGADQRGRSLALGFGVILEHHRATPLTHEMVASSDLILAMDYPNEAELLARFPAARDKIWLLREYVGHGAAGEFEIPDPYMGDEDDVRQAYEVLARCVTALAERLSSTGR